jgi:hypothetical protein
MSLSLVQHPRFLEALSWDILTCNEVEDVLLIHQSGIGFNDERFRHLPLFFALDGYDGTVGYFRMRSKDAFPFGGRTELSHDANHFPNSAQDVDESFLVDVAEVA